MTDAQREGDELPACQLMESPTPLRSLTTLEVGGPPRYEAEVSTDQALRALARWAKSKGLALYPLGAGSNILCSDEPLNGVILRLSERELIWDAPVAKNGPTILTASAGLTWDELVEESVHRGLAGLECLSGIPGQVGAAPIQNIGAYGQSLSDTCVGVKVYDTLRDELDWWGPARCGWSYRSSVFKRHPGRFVILKVRFALRQGGPVTLSYPQLAERFPQAQPSLQEVRDEVLKLRRSKSMVYDLEDPNHRSAGSFFLNPVLSAQGLRALERRAAEGSLPPPPRWPEGAGFKVPAAWLIERSGCPRGYGEGRAGLSTQHCLAIVNRGAASAEELIRLARDIQLKVHDSLGVWLSPEVNLWGFERSPLAPPSAEPNAVISSQAPGARVALASCSALPPWERDDAPLLVELERRGVVVSCPQWDDPLVEWGQYDLVIPRTTWNYQEQPTAFLRWLEEIEEKSTLVNSGEVIRWNLNKRYLKALEELKVPTPPTCWLEQVSSSADAPSPEALKALCEARGWRRAFLKPTLAANAWGTLRFNVDQQSDLELASAHLSALLTQRSFILQPYYEGVERDGEFSMIFFGERLSHGVQKIPLKGDYRVQDDHGATDHPWSPPESWVQEGERLLKALPYRTAYARVDCLAGPQGGPHLIELELIEPSLFFRHDPAAPGRFAEVICAQLSAQRATRS